MKDGYSFASENNGCVISKNNMFVAFASIVNGLFVLNIDDSPVILMLKGLGLLI